MNAAASVVLGCGMRELAGLIIMPYVSVWFGCTGFQPVPQDFKTDSSSQNVYEIRRGRSGTGRAFDGEFVSQHNPGLGGQCGCDLIDLSPVVNEMRRA